MLYFKLYIQVSAIPSSQYWEWDSYDAILDYAWEKKQSIVAAFDQSNHVSESYSLGLGKKLFVFYRRIIYR